MPSHHDDDSDYANPPVSPAATRRPYFAIVSLVFLASILLIPIIGYAFTYSAIEKTPNDGQNFGVFILAVMGFLAVALAIGLAGLGSAISGAISLARGENYRWIGWLGLIVGLLVSLAVFGTAFAVYLFS